MTKFLKSVTVAIAATGMLASALPASAAVQFGSDPAAQVMNGAEGVWQHGRDRGRHEGWYGRGSDRGYNQRGYDDEPVYRNTRTWRGDDGRSYCRRQDGTTGLLIGGAVGGLIGNEVAGRGDRTLGVILGVAGGALLGREIDRSGSRCR